MSFLFKTLAAFAGAYALIVIGAYLGQRKLMYVPDPQRISPRSAGLAGVEERLIETADGERVVAWRAAAAPGQPTVLYFHGNAGHLAARAERIRAFQQAGWGVLMMSYRGYSGSTGSPSETANIADARLAYAMLAREGVIGDALIVYGESLGTGVAIKLACEHAVGMLVLDSPFTSMVDMAVRVYPFLPSRQLLSDRYESDRDLPGVKAPVLVMHGARDQVVPVTMGREMHALAPEPKRLVIFPEGNHSDLFAHGAMTEILAFWQETRRGR